MSTSQNKEEDKGTVGCLMLALIVFGGGIIIQVLQTLMMFAIIGGIGFALYRLYVYDQRTGNLTAWAERNFNLNKEEEGEPHWLEQENEAKALPPASEQQLLELRQKIELLEREKEEQKLNTENAVQRAANEAVNRYANQADYNAKKDLLDSIYGDNSTSPQYTRSDEYEKQQFQKKIEQKEEELEVREFRQEVNERILGQDQNILGIQSEMREGFQETNNRFLQMEYKMMQMQQEFQQGLMKVMETIHSLKAYFDERINRLEIHIERELANVREIISGLRVELKQDIANTKLQFGQEIMRIDKQQQQIVGKLAHYEAKMKGFTAEMAKMRHDAQRFAWEGQKVLERAHVLYQRHKVEMTQMGGQLDLNIQRIAVSKQEFANTVGRSRLMMDKITQDQYLALKDIGYERMGVEMLRQDYQQRQRNDELKLQSIQQDIRHTEQMIQEKLSRGEQVAGLNHQLTMSREKHAHTQQRLSLLREETSMMKRLAR